MKKTYTLFVIALLSISNIYAQKVPSDKVPAVVLAAFVSKYPEGRNEKWETDSTMEYEVSFRLPKKAASGTKMSAKFDKDGKWLETEIDLKFFALPNQVAEAINSTYPGYKVKEVEKEETPEEGSLYEVKISKGALVLEVLITPEGKILKSEKEE